MKKIELSKKQENKEKVLAEQKRLKQEAMDKALEEFKSHPARPYVIKFFKDYEEQFIGELEEMQASEMRKLYMLPLKEQRAKLVEMSKRDVVLTGVLSILKRVKRKL